MPKSKTKDHKKMRLKFFFFPAMLVFSFAIFIMYIWPEIDNIKAANEGYANETKSLEAVNQKKVAINKIDDQLNADVESSDMVMNFLPSKKSEDRILAEINHIASGSEVALIGIEPQAAPAVEESTPAVVPVNPAPSAIADGSDVGGAGPAPVVAPAKTDTPSKDIRYSSMKITVNGTFEKLHGFFDQIQKMDIYNSTRSISIKTQAKNSTSGSQQADSASSGDSLLAAEMVVDFGYLDPVKLSSSNLGGFSPTLDTQTMESLKNFVTQKSPALDSANKGRNNPFFQ